MAIIFRYKRIRREGKDGNPVYIYTPSIPVTLIGKEGIDVIALIDSGADHCIISRGLAELIGLDLKHKPEETKGIGGVVHCIPSFMNILIKNAHERYQLHRVPVFVLTDKNSDIPPILGRIGFFDEFEIKFRQKELKIFLKKV